MGKIIEIPKTGLLASLDLKARREAEKILAHYQQPDRLNGPQRACLVARLSMLKLDTIAKLCEQLRVQYSAAEDAKRILRVDPELTRLIETKNISMGRALKMIAGKSIPVREEVITSSKSRMILALSSIEGSCLGLSAIPTEFILQSCAAGDELSHWRHSARSSALALRRWADSVDAKKAKNPSGEVNQRIAVYHFFKISGEVGATDIQCSDALKIPTSSARSRRKELEDMRLIVSVPNMDKPAIYKLSSLHDEYDQQLREKENLHNEPATFNRSRA